MDKQKIAKVYVAHQLYASAAKESYAEWIKWKRLTGFVVVICIGLLLFARACSLTALWWFAGPLLVFVVARSFYLRRVFFSNTQKAVTLRAEFERLSN